MKGNFVSVDTLGLINFISQKRLCSTRSCWDTSILLESIKSNKLCRGNKQKHGRDGRYHFTRTGSERRRVGQLRNSSLLPACDCGATVALPQGDVHTTHTATDISQNRILFKSKYPHLILDIISNRSSDESRNSPPLNGVLNPRDWNCRTSRIECNTRNTMILNPIKIREHFGLKLFVKR